MKPLKRVQRKILDSRNYINGAKTTAARQKRKNQVWSYMYGMSPRTFAEMLHKR